LFSIIVIFVFIICWFYPEKYLSFHKREIKWQYDNFPFFLKVFPFSPLIRDRKTIIWFSRIVVTGMLGMMLLAIFASIYYNIIR